MLRIGIPGFGMVGAGAGKIFTGEALQQGGPIITALMAVLIGLYSLRLTRSIRRLSRI